MSLTRAAVLAAFASLYPAMAAAEPVRLLFTGEITSTGAGLDGAFTVGGMSTWELAYDTLQAPVVGGATSTYGPTAFGTWSGDFDGQHLALDEAQSANQWMSTVDHGDTKYVGWSVNSYGTRSYALAGSTVQSLLPWAFFAGVTVPTSAFSGLPLDLGTASDGTFSLYYRDERADDIQRVDGRILRVERIPEPATVLLVLSGLVSAGWVARRRRHD